MFSDSSISRTRVERRATAAPPSSRSSASQVAGSSCRVGARVAQLVRALAKEPERAGRARAAARASGSRPPARRRRATGAGSGRRPMRANASAMTCALSVELARVGDVRVQAAAAQRIGEAARGDPATARRPSTVVGVRDALADPLDARAHALAGNRAGDEHDLAVGARDHPAAGGRLLDRRAERSGRVSASSASGPHAGGPATRSLRTRSSAARTARAPGDRSPRRARARTRRRHADRETRASSSSASRAERRARRPRRARRAPRAAARASSAASRATQRLARLAAQAAAPRARRVELARDAIDAARRTPAPSAPARARRRQPQHDALEMRRQRRTGAAARLIAVDRRPVTVDCRLSVTPSRPAPLVEHVEHVGLAEVDPHRPAARTLAVVALEVAIDAATRDLERHAAAPPSRRRARTTGRRRESGGRRSSGRGRFRSRGSSLRRPICDRVISRFRSHTIRSPCSVRSGSTCSNERRSRARSRRPGRRSRRRCALPPSSSRHPPDQPLDHADVAVEQPGLHRADRRPADRRVAGLRTSMRGSRAAR